MTGPRGLAGLEIWTVYDNPKDYPGKFVARLFINETITHQVLVKDDLRVLRQQLRNKGLTRLVRAEQDDPVIVETWI